MILLKNKKNICIQFAREQWLYQLEGKIDLVSYFYCYINYKFSSSNLTTTKKLFIYLFFNCIRIHLLLILKLKINKS